MALAAQYFLSAVHGAVSESTIHLVEGFVVGADSGDHDQVALDLRLAFVGLEECTWHSPPDRAKSVLDWVMREPGQPSPLILAPRYA